jgi:dihydrodipicolinate synthase/N-acetylneuraminate lyase
MCSLQLLVGSDQIFTRARCARVPVPGGATRPGAISAAACAVPELLMALDRAITVSQTGEIDRLDRALQEFLYWEVRFPPTTIVKVATGLRGLKTGPLSVPLSPGKERLLAEFREWFQSWLPDVKKMAAHA